MSFPWAKHYEPTTDVGKWIDSRLPLPRLIYDSVGAGYPVPKNLNYFYNFGVLAGVALVVQIITGIILAMHYAPNTGLAFNSVEHIMRDVNSGWMLRYMHAVGASFFFIVVYLHIFRGLYYGSYKPPREVLWLLGMVIYLLMMATGFISLQHPQHALGRDPSCNAGNAAAGMAARTAKIQPRYRRLRPAKSGRGTMHACAQGPKIDMRDTAIRHVQPHLAFARRFHKTPHFMLEAVIIVRHLRDD